MTEKGTFQDGARRCIKPKEVEVAELFKNPLLSLFLIPIPPAGSHVEALGVYGSLGSCLCKMLSFLLGRSVFFT